MGSEKWAAHAGGRQAEALSSWTLARTTHAHREDPTRGPELRPRDASSDASEGIAALLHERRSQSPTDLRLTYPTTSDASDRAGASQAPPFRPPPRGEQRHAPAGDAIGTGTAPARRFDRPRPARARLSTPPVRPHPLLKSCTASSSRPAASISSAGPPFSIMPRRRCFQSPWAAIAASSRVAVVC